MRRLMILCLSLVAMVCLATTCIAQQVDLKAMFLASNPNNGWEYGYIDENGEFIAYNSTFDDGQGIAGWCMDNLPGVVGDVTINYTDQPIDRYGIHWEPGEVCAVPSQLGNVVIRWTSLDTAELQADTTLTQESPYSETNMAVYLDGQQVDSSKLGESQANRLNAVQSMSASGRHEKRRKHTRSVKLKMKHGSKVEFRLSPVGEDMPPSHVGTSIFLNIVGQDSALSLKSAFGNYAPSKQAKAPSQISSVFGAANPFASDHKRFGLADCLTLAGGS